MTTLAVTGGIGSGKSAACRILSSMGVPVYDSDSAAKELYQKDNGLLASIEAAFGCRFRLADGSFDKRALAKVAFSSEANLDVLESLVHPAVLEDFIQWRDKCEAEVSINGWKFPSINPFVVIESAIVMSKPEFMAEVDKVLFIEAGENVRLGRTCVRDGSAPREVLDRMSRQVLMKEKADAVVVNDGTLSELEDGILAAISSLSL